MGDIKNREDIKVLIDAFYKKAIDDKTIGYIFTNVVQLDFEKHMPVMYDFWESVLFSRSVYKGNVMVKHIDLDKQEALTKEHFEQWKSLFIETVEARFEGKNAEEAKRRVHLMSELMQYKIGKSRGEGFIQ